MSYNVIRLQNILDGMETELKAEIVRNRNDKFQHLNLSNEALDQQIFHKALTAPEAVEHG